ncbi:hypothetical protein [Actinomadura craniellae]|nr:hypothetical protein [Actinomadura craniellae]
MADAAAPASGTVAVTAYGLGVPLGTGRRVSRWTDAVALDRDPGGRVRASRRLGGPGGTAPPAAETADRAAGRLVGSTLDALGAAPLQSVLATVRCRVEGPAGETAWRAHVVARIETAAGPVLIGSATGDPDALPALEGPPATRPGTPPAGWTDLPIVLAPPVAAMAVGAARLALASRSGRAMRERMAGRRAFHDLSLHDVPVAHPSGGLDDAGAPVTTAALLDAGRLTPPGTPSGRAVWDHDRRALGPAPVTRLELDGPPLPVPEPAVELAWCVEGVQRYDPGGVLRLTCLARVADRWFPAVLRARPLRLLQAARGVAGPRTRTFSEDELESPSLLLPGARGLRERGSGAVESP